MIEFADAKIINYQFEVPIQRCASDTWLLMIDQIDDWWMGDFRALGEGSKITLHAEAGGQLIETAADGSALEWYRVQMVVPMKSLYLVGYMAPDWGGPTTSMLKVAIEERGQNCALIVSDALFGNVTEASAGNAEGGWKLLFENGLKGFAEK